MSTPRKPLAVGERVRVFSHYGPYDGTVDAVDVSGNTPKGFVRGLLRIKNKDGEMWLQHPRQCVRLRKKPAVERVERWVSESHTQTITAVLHREPTGVDKPIHLVELRENERVVSLADLGKAWDSCQCFTHGFGLAKHSAMFKELVANLFSEAPNDRT